MQVNYEGSGYWEMFFPEEDITVVLTTRQIEEIIEEMPDILHEGTKNENPTIFQE